MKHALGIFAFCFLLSAFAEAQIGPFMPGGMPSYTAPTSAVDSSLPPTNNFIRAIGNPLSGNGIPAGKLLAENIVQDPVSSIWFMVGTSNGSTAGVFLLTNSVDPRITTNCWGWVSNLTVGGSSTAPHLLWSTNSYWYLYFSTNSANIVVGSNTSPYGPFTNNPSVRVVVSVGAGGSWKQSRVLEGYFFQRADGVYQGLYMGDAGGPAEQVGSVTAPDPGGPWTDQSVAAPFIAFGAGGTYDAGTVADPWCVYWQGVYWIGYACSATSSSPWQTAIGWTTDFVTFHKIGLLFTVAGSGWDNNNSFRGAVVKYGRQWLLSYTGDTYDIGIATSPADSLAPNVTSISNTPGVYTNLVSFTADINANCGAALGTVSGTYTITNSESVATLSNWMHTVTFSGLLPGVTYYAKPITTNWYGGAVALGAETSFTTLNRITNGLVGWWKLNESSGTTANDSSVVNNNAGTLSAPPYSPPTWTTTSGTNYLQFTGSGSNYVSYGNVMNMGLSDWSISYWYKTTTTPSSAIGMVGKSFAAAGYRWGSYLSSASLYDLLDPNGTALSANFGPPLDGNWHLVVVIWTRAGNMIQYCDSTTAKTTTSISTASAVNITGPCYFWVGCCGGTTGVGNIYANSYFTGGISDVRVFNRALNAATEIPVLIQEGPSH